MQFLTWESIHHNTLSLSVSFLSTQSLEEILHPLSVHNAVLNLILLFFRHFHIPVETVFPKEWKHSHSTTNKKRTRYPYSRKKNPWQSITHWNIEDFTARIGLHGFGALTLEDFLGVSEALWWQIKAAAVRYKHICSRDCSLLQASLTSPIHSDKGWRLFPHLSCVKMPHCLFLFITSISALLHLSIQLKHGVVFCFEAIHEEDLTQYTMLD